MFAMLCTSHKNVQNYILLRESQSNLIKSIIKELTINKLTASGSGVENEREGN